MMLSVIVLSFVSLLSTLVAGAPTASVLPSRLGRRTLCAIPFFSGYCKTDDPNAATVIVGGYGQAKGVKLGNGAVRFVAQYATAQRFKNPIATTDWTPVNDSYTALPPACPQGGVSGYSEDCLYAVMYVPESSLAKLDMEFLPVFVWLHGGSFVSGSATGPGLDASKFAVQTNSIVVVLQYRLGVLGLLPPTGTEGASGNLAVKDVISALQFVRNVVFWFGGNPLAVTVGGQSSGGHMVRALLAAPSASNLFRAGALFGDPVNYGFLKTSVYQSLQSNFWGSTSTSASVDTIISAQSTFYQTSPRIDPSVGTGEPIRPTLDGTLITTGLTTTYPSQKKPLWISTNKNEAGTSIGNIPAGVIDLMAYRYGIIYAAIGQTRGDIFLNSPYYNPDPAKTSPVLLQPYDPSTDIILQAIERGGTDQLWKCAGWDLAKRWTGQGGKAWVGEFEVGATYPSNAAFPYCTTNGRVCHQDEILPLFGTTTSPTAAQTALTTEIQARMKSFLWNPQNGPTATGYANWQPAASSDAHAIQLGGTADGSAAPVGGCVAGFWGTTLGGVLAFDWEYYNE